MIFINVIVVVRYFAQINVGNGNLLVLSLENVLHFTQCYKHCNKNKLEIEFRTILHWFVIAMAIVVGEFSVVSIFSLPHTNTSVDQVEKVCMLYPHNHTLHISPCLLDNICKCVILLCMVEYHKLEKLIIWFVFPK